MSSSACSSYDVVVLGGGASGLFCAFTAAQRGRRVLVLERSNKVGKKILMSGGGRCNFTNYSVEPTHFLSANPHFCKAALSRYSQWDFIHLVEQHQVEYESRQHDQLFCTQSAKDILVLLLDECEQAGVQIMTQVEVSRVDIQQLPDAARDGQFRLRYSTLSSGPMSSNKATKRPPAVELPQESFSCESLVVATGALSIPTLGGSGFGYTLAEQFGIALRPQRAGLVPFMFTDATKKLCERLSGVSLPARVSCNNQDFYENILFTHRGISGPAILQISNYWMPGDRVCIDLLPSVEAPLMLSDAKRLHAKLLLRSHLSTVLPKALVMELQAIWWKQYADIPMAEIPEKALLALGGQLNSWVVKPSATEGYRTAEVTLGGVDTGALSSKTFEAKTQKGLFFIGEVVDVTGHLGGFNFQWAWSSGYSAGLVV